MPEIPANPKHAAALDAAIEKLDAESLALLSNHLTGGSLRADDARKVARMVAESALRAPGKVIRVAGISAAFSHGHLTLSVCGDIADILIPETDL